MERETAALQEQLTVIASSQKTHTEPKDSEETTPASTEQKWCAQFRPP